MLLVFGDDSVNQSINTTATVRHSATKYYDIA